MKKEKRREEQENKQENKTRQKCESGLGCIKQPPLFIGEEPIQGKQDTWAWPKPIIVILFTTLPLDDHPLRMCLVKTLLGKTLWDKNLVKEKEYNILESIIIHCLIKNLT